MTPDAPRVGLFVAEKAADGPSQVAPEIAALVPAYLASKRKQLADAQARLAARDLSPVQRFGHNLKGTGRGYGFPELEQIGREIEAAAKLSDEISISLQLESLRRFLSHTETY
jgi:HPt (histidine-containing phosphotransfer) domain-containing protein